MAYSMYVIIFTAGESVCQVNGFMWFIVLMCESCWQVNQCVILMTVSGLMSTWEMNRCVYSCM